MINVRGWRQGRDGWLFVVMDYLEGRDLDRLLLDELDDSKPGLSWERTLALLEPIAAGLDYAHAQGILHRDLKPGNVFITQRREVKLLDFGLAYRLHRSSTMIGIQETDASGTPEYMPPEAFVAGEPDKARDIYALACLTYEMLTGEPPFSPGAARWRNPELMMPGKPGVLTEAAWEVLKSGLAYRKEERPGSAGELVGRLAVAQRAEPEPVEKASSPEVFKSELPPVQNIHGWPAEKVKSLQQQTAAALSVPVEFHDRLRDGSQGPAMVVIPAGEFLMGSPKDEEGRFSNERLHEVRIERPFAVGKYAVTFEAYDRFVRATGRKKPEGWGCGRRPVINVSWEDAVAYAEWLSEQTDQSYRLPTEAEWEYAAWAGTATPYHFGATITTKQANYDTGGLFSIFAGTIEVGQFPPNVWGLYDVHGNVWEWTCSAYDDNYGGAELNCISKNCADPRVLRGGSWGDNPHGVRAANRYRLTPGFPAQRSGVSPGQAVLTLCSLYFYPLRREVENAP